LGLPIREKGKRDKTYRTSLNIEKKGNPEETFETRRGKGERQKRKIKRRTVQTTLGRQTRVQKLVMRETKPEKRGIEMSIEPPLQRNRGG